MRNIRVSGNACYIWQMPLECDRNMIYELASPCQISSNLIARSLAHYYHFLYYTAFFLQLATSIGFNIDLNYEIKLLFWEREARILNKFFILGQELLNWHIYRIVPMNIRWHYLWPGILNNFVVGKEIIWC